MFSLAVINSKNYLKWRGFKGQYAGNLHHDDMIAIAQKYDCSSYLVLTTIIDSDFEKQSSIPKGYEFIFRQEWGQIYNEDTIHRVISTLRKEAYPPIEDYLDAKVKGDAEQEINYILACQAVKEKYPKFSF